MNDFLQYIKPRQEEDDVRKDVVKRVEAVIKQLWPKARVRKNKNLCRTFLIKILRAGLNLLVLQVELYGSCQTGLYLPTR